MKTNLRRTSLIALSCLLAASASCGNPATLPGSGPLVEGDAENADTGTEVATGTRATQPPNRVDSANQEKAENAGDPLPSTPLPERPLEPVGPPSSGESAGSQMIPADKPPVTAVMPEGALPPAPRKSALALLRSVPAVLLETTRGGRPNAQGVVGSNNPTWVGAGNQRGAMDLMVVGIVLKNTTDVEDAWRAVEETFRHQDAQGHLGSDVTSDAFWMAWMNYALLLLQQSEYADTYKPKIQALKPKFAKTMEFLLKQSSKDELRKANHGSPNRTLIIANAYAFGSLLLADVISPETKKAYLAEADFWIRNEFENDKLFRSFDGIFLEHGGYDTGYHGVALWMAIMHHLHFPNSIPNAEQKFAAASRWLEKRILPNGVVDCTFNTRSGPNNAIGDAKNTDLLGVKRALFYSGALLGQSSAFDAAKRASQSINGLPPVFFSAETVRGKKGIPFQFDVLATNSGLKALDSSFTMSASNLPSWLSFAPGPYGFYKSTASLKLQGTPSSSGTFKVRLTGSNSYGDAVPVDLTVIIE